MCGMCGLCNRSAANLNGGYDIRHHATVGCLLLYIDLGLCNIIIVKIINECCNLIVAVKKKPRNRLNMCSLYNWAANLYDIVRYYCFCNYPANAQFIIIEYKT